jgi:16S rRNA (cytidine1402-2'-O)-methyltransferase
LNTFYTSVLAAAQLACGDQDYPASTLYVVATPIGNRADITLRALVVLQMVDAIACEDTRHTGQLLATYGLQASASKPLLALHQHNEVGAAQDILARLAAGQRVAYVSDAGTPAISDPGAKLVHIAQQAGYRVMPLPGASSATALMSVAGVVQEGGYTFIGFLPHGANDRKQALQQAFNQPRAVVLFEAPHRIEALARDVAQLGAAHDRLITVGRELTKQFEDVTTLKAADWPAHLAANSNAARGEFAIVIHPETLQEASADAVDTQVLALLLKELPVKTAVKLAADITGQSRNALYAAALVLKVEAK